MSWIITHFEIVFAVLVVLGAVVVLLQQRRTPQSTVAWLMAIAVLPYFAVPLFLILGFRKQVPKFSPISYTDCPPEDIIGADPTERLLQRLGLPGATTGNSVRLLTTGEAAWEGLMELVASAWHSLDVEFYIIAKDAVGVAFMTALTQKAREGVRVRVLLDRLGTLWPPRKAVTALREAGGQVLFFSRFLRLPTPGHLNLRNHRKLVIADGERAFSGGMNVGEEYLGPDPDAERWTDLAFLMEGPVVPASHDIFLSDWVVAGGATGNDVQAAPRRAGAALVQPVPSGPDLKADPLHDGLVHAIHAAQERVWIVTPYFLPTELLSHAVSLAARRGVDVRLVLPRKSNQKLADFARGAYMREMAEAGARVLF